MFSPYIAPEKAISVIKVNEIPFVAYPVTDLQRARDFYEGVLGFKVTLDSSSPAGSWIEYDISESTLAISSYWKPAATPAMGPAAALEVENFETTVALLKSKGVPFTDGPHETRGCFMVMIADPDGNSLWIHQHKTEAGEAGDKSHRVTEIPFVAYPVADKGRALAFYEGIFGLKFDPGYVAPDGFWTEASIGSGTLALCSFWKPSAEPLTGPCVAFELEILPAQSLI